VRRAWRSLRVQLAVLGFLAIYLPVLLLFGVTVATEDETVETRDGVVIADDASSGSPSPWATATVVALGPAAAGLAWWWSGRAIRPLRHAAETQRRLVEETSHELRTPLSVLVVNADVLLADPDPTVEAYRRGLERSKAAAARMQATIDDLLVDARGRARTLDRRPADLMAIARGVVDEAGVVAGRHHVTLSLSGPASAVCPVDEATVRRAVANVVDNAVGHAPAGSAVEIEVGLSETHATVVVTDHGPGIPAEQQDQVFERFWRARPDAQGTGLGLPIARQIAQAHGGDLTVLSPGPDGDGCAFTLTLRR
jgi:signal transduction histidine kinase